MLIQERLFHLPGTFSQKIVGLALLLGLSLVSSGLVWPPPPEPAKIEFVQAFSRAEDLKIEKNLGQKLWEFVVGEAPEQQARLIKPQAVCAADGKVYVTDTALACVHVFNTREQAYFRLSQAADQRLGLPVGVAVGPDGKIYVADSQLKAVLIYSAQGKYLGELGRGQFERPTGLAFNQAAGRLYVVDTLAGAIKIFGPDGKLLSQFGRPGEKPGEFNHPTYLALDQQGDVYVVDSLNFRVEIFSSEGKLVSVFGKAGSGSGAFALPKGIAVDSQGHIYVSDAKFDNVQIFNRQGELLLYFGRSGNQPGQFWLPAGLFIDETDKIYAADSGNQRVEIFKYLK